MPSKSRSTLVSQASPTKSLKKKILQVLQNFQFLLTHRHPFDPCYASSSNYRKRHQFCPYRSPFGLCWQSWGSCRAHFRLRHYRCPESISCNSNFNKVRTYLIASVSQAVVVGVGLVSVENVSAVVWKVEKIFTQGQKSVNLLYRMHHQLYRAHLDPCRLDRDCGCKRNCPKRKFKIN